MLKFQPNTQYLLILLLGFTTPLMTLFVPQGSGGISLILVLSIPFFIILSLLFILIQYLMIKYNKPKKLIHINFIISCFILILTAIGVYPY